MMDFFAYVACVVLAFWIGGFSGRNLLRIKVLNAVNYQRQQAHYNSDQKTVNILDNLIERIKDA